MPTKPVTWLRNSFSGAVMVSVLVSCRGVTLPCCVNSYVVIMIFRNLLRKDTFFRYRTGTRLGPVRQQVGLQNSMNLRCFFSIILVMT